MGDKRVNIKEMNNPLLFKEGYRLGSQIAFFNLLQEKTDPFGLKVTKRSQISS